MLQPSDNIDAIQASLLRALASPHRLRIVHALGNGPCEVNELAHRLGISQTSASQHLSAMRSVGLVEPLRDGRIVRYRLTDDEILVACEMVRDVLLRRLSRLGDLAAAVGYPLDTTAVQSR
jgi:ArsR family transcriptional regulator, virulence genes transcriptional regulator